MALQATADGNCFYNAISIALLGNESLALELRIACCTEMLLNRKRYIYHPLADGLAKVAGGPPTNNSFEEPTLSCAQIDGWAGP